jgi:hypothetical protein
MQTERIVVDQSKARELHALYHAHRKDETAMDAEIRRAYKLIGQGKMIIQALASIVAAGVKEDGTLKLALCNAEAKRCRLEMYDDGRALMFRDGRRANHTDQTNVFRLPAGTFPYVKRERFDFVRNYTAVVPMIPIHLRPRSNLASYHILWEAEWSRAIPVDPMLLRRLRGDMWIVVAAWDLTDVERAAMASRLTS